MKQLATIRQERVIAGLMSHSPLVDSLDSIGGIRATVHVAVLSAGKALQEPDAYREGDSLVRDCALRTLRQDLPYLLLVLGSASPEGAESRAQALEGLRILSADSSGGLAAVLASRVLAAAGEEGETHPALRMDAGRISKAVLSVEAAEDAMLAEMDQFESSRRKMIRHRAYDSLEGAIPDMLLCLESDMHDESSRRGLRLLRDRVTPLVRPGAVLSGLVLERIERPAAQPESGQRPEQASVDLAQ